MSERTQTASNPSFSHLTAIDPRQLLRIVRREWRLVALAVAVCLTVGIIGIVKTPRTYQATARLLVLHTGSQPLKVAETETGSREVMEDQFPTYSAILSSPRIVGGAIQKAGIENLPSVQEMARERSMTPTQAAIEELSVSRPDRSASVLRIDFRAYSKEEAVRMVAALVDEFEAFLKEKYQSDNTRVVELITEARDLMNEELEDLESEYLELRKKNAALAIDADGRSFVARRLDEWNAAINNALVRSVQLEAQLELGRELEVKGVGLTGIAYALSQLSGDPTHTLAIGGSVSRNQALASDYVRQLIAQQQQLAERFSPEYSKVREIEDQIRGAQEVAVSSRRSLEKVEIDDLIRSIEQALTATSRLKDVYEQRFERDLEDARVMLAEQAEEENLRMRLDRQQRLFNTVVDQLKQAQLVREYSGVATQAIEPPHALRKPVRPRVMLTLALALFSGAVFGLVGALGADTLDSRIRSIDELRAVLQTRVLGMIPRLSKLELADGGDPGLIVHAKPNSVPAESYRALRTGIEFVRRERNIRSILVCSPSPGDGKSTVSSNIAAALAQAGRRVILVDCDLRKPSQDAIHDVEREPGLGQVLRDGMDWREAIRKTVVADLDLLTAGCMIPNPTELLMTQRFREILGELGEAYDQVVIDTSPLLYVADPSIIGPAVDGLLLVVRPSEFRRPEAHRTLEVLQMMKTPVIGTVVNADEAEGAPYTRYGRYYGRHGGYGGYGQPGQSSTPWETVVRSLRKAVRPSSQRFNAPRVARSSTNGHPTPNGAGHGSRTGSEPPMSEETDSGSV